MNLQQKPFTLILGVLLMFLGQARITAAEYAIGADDVIRISVYGYDEIKTETRVSAEGRITFPLAGEVQVSGKSTFEVEQELASLLVKGGYIIDPHVTVMVLEFKSRQVSVLGQVNKPGRYALESANTLVDVIAMAGGINSLGDEKAILTRKHESGETHKKEVDLREVLESSENTEQIQMQQGDIVYVPRAPVFYIYGDVQRPGGYRLESALTVAQAISLGGGLTPKGTDCGIVIKRKNSNGKVQELDVELTDNVQKDDVIFVDESWF